MAEALGSPPLLWVIIGAVMLMELVTAGTMSRRVWREASRILTLLDMAAVGIVRRIYPPRYVLLGACQQRGICCKNIVGNPPTLVKRSFLLSIFIAYHRVFHNFAVAARGPDDEIIFSCGHLGSDGRCGIYRYRPYLCRNYPIRPWFEPPQLLPGCGFRVAHRAVAKMKRRASLPVLDADVAVHHPSPPLSVGIQTAKSSRRNDNDSSEPAGPAAAVEQPEHFEWVEKPPMGKREGPQRP